MITVERMTTPDLKRLIEKMEWTAPPCFLSARDPSYDNALMELAMRKDEIID